MKPVVALMLAAASASTSCPQVNDAAAKLTSLLKETSLSSANRVWRRENPALTVESYSADKPHPQLVYLFKYPTKSRTAPKRDSADPFGLNGSGTGAAALEGNDSILSSLASIHCFRDTQHTYFFVSFSDALNDLLSLSPIQAAPQLLEALEAMIENYDSFDFKFEASLPASVRSALSDLKDATEINRIVNLIVLDALTHFVRSTLFYNKGWSKAEVAQVQKVVQLLEGYYAGVLAGHKSFVRFDEKKGVTFTANIDTLKKAVARVGAPARLLSPSK